MILMSASAALSEVYASFPANAPFCTCKSEDSFCIPLLTLNAKRPLNRRKKNALSSKDRKSSIAVKSDGIDLLYDRTNLF